MQKMKNNSCRPEAGKQVLLRAAVAVGEFGAWFILAAERRGGAWMSFPASELRERLDRLQAALGDTAAATIPTSTSRRLESLLSSIRSELRDEVDGVVSLGVFVVDDALRAFDLLKLHARERGLTDERLAPLERRGLLDVPSRISKR